MSPVASIALLVAMGVVAYVCVTESIDKHHRPKGTTAMTNSTTFYAISSLGYGRASTAAQARANHREELIEARPRAARAKEWAARVDEIEPTLLRAPAEATGFVLQSGTVYWTDGGTTLRRAGEEDLVSE